MTQSQVQAVHIACIIAVLAWALITSYGWWACKMQADADASSQSVQIAELNQNLKDALIKLKDCDQTQGENAELLNRVMHAEMKQSAAEKGEEIVKLENEALSAELFRVKSEPHKLPSKKRKS